LPWSSSLEKALGGYDEELAWVEAKAVSRTPAALIRELGWQTRVR